MNLLEQQKRSDKLYSLMRKAHHNIETLPYFSRMYYDEDGRHIIVAQEVNRERVAEWVDVLTKAREEFSTLRFVPSVAQRY